MFRVVQGALGLPRGDVTSLVLLYRSRVHERLFENGQHLEVGGDHETGRLLGEASGPDDVLLVELEPHLGLLQYRGHVVIPRLQGLNTERTITTVVRV